VSAKFLRARRRAVAIAALGAAAVAVAATPVLAGAAGRSSERELTKDAEGSYEVLEGAEQYAVPRTAPADEVDAAAFTSARTAAASLPVTGGAWTEVTDKPYNNDSPEFPGTGDFSNSGAGWGLVSGRMTALAVDGSSLYAGAADGGVWKSTNGGSTWRPLTDAQPTLAVGALAVNPSDHSLWLGTGEANVNFDGYAGIGVLRSTDGGRSWNRVGGSQLENHTIMRLVFDGAGNVYAATAYGLYRRSASNFTAPWQLVLKPCLGQYDTTYISDVTVRPGTHGQDVVAVVGWRAGSACNGFYESKDGGATFNRITVNGSINDNQIGRTTLAYAADGTKLYALVQSSQLFNSGATDFGGTLLMGVFASPSGSAAGSWQKIAEWRNLSNSGSALKGHQAAGYHPGVQAWYNQFLAVDPADRNHVYLGLEEVYETRDGGGTWKTIGPYWNYPFPCADNGVETCPPTTHPDQHAVAIANGKVYVGNDGGVYSRPLRNAPGWTNLNATLRTLQYYYADLGPVSGGDAIWGGLQDNGESLLLPGATEMVSPFGGDGGDTLVDHTNGNRAVVEYVDLDLAKTTDGGHNWTEITPSCFAFSYTPSPCDPNPRFIAPFEADVADPTHWVAGGEFVWDSTKGWDTSCSASSCDFEPVHDTGPGNSVTALAVNRGVIYAAWCGGGVCNPPTFQSGIDTNYGGTWHRVAGPGIASGLPNRYVFGLTVDPANAAHVYAVYSGFSRRWIPGGGFGHVFESTDGGAHWTNIDGNLPDAPADDLVLVHGRLVLSTDIGVFVAGAGGGGATAWSRYGTGLPNASTNDLQLSPDETYLIGATHGRGIWKIAAP
jgi:photosystem II stability/assembly factor-like uncharacterized protein